MERQEKILKVIIWLVFLTALAFFLRYLFVCLFFPYPLHYREGVMTNWLRQLAKGKSLYPVITFSGPFVHNPYLPNFYLLSLPFYYLFSRYGIFLPARLLSMLSLLLSAGLIFSLVKKKAGTTLAILSVSLFLFSPVTVYVAGSLQPDTTGLFLVLAALTVSFLTSFKYGAIFSGFLASLSFFVKPFFLAVAFGCGAAWREKKCGLTYLFSFFLFFSLFLLAITLCWGHGFWQHFWQLNMSGFSLRQFFHLLVQVSGRHVILFSMVIFSLFSRKKQWWQSYLICVVLAIFFSLKIGAEENYYLELVAAGSICLAFLPGETAQQQVVYLLCLAQLFLYLPLKPAAVFTRTYGQEVPAVVSSLTPDFARRQVGQLICSALRPLPEPVISEDVGYLLLSGHEVFFQPYQFTQLARQAKWPEGIILQMVREKKFSAIVLSAESYQEKSVFFSPSFLRKVKSCYVISRIIGNYYLLEPLR